MVNAVFLFSIIMAVVKAHGVTDTIAPDASAPTGCSASFDGTFGFYIQTLSPSATSTARSKRARALLENMPFAAEPRAANAVLEPRAAPEASELPVACATDNTLTMTLDGTIIKDRHDRTAYIASNRQFQFDDPPQSGSIYTAGFSACDDGAIALGGSKTFYQCLSGDFYNLYDQHWAEQCEPVQMMLVKLLDCESGEMISRSKRKEVEM